MGRPPSPNLDDDPEFRALLARQRRDTFRRTIGMGLAAVALAVAGAITIAYGKYLDAAQAHSEMHFYFPGRMQFVGWLLVVVGVIGAAVAFVGGLRIRRRLGRPS